MLRLVVLVLALVSQATAQFSFSGSFEDMFGGGGGSDDGGHGGGREPTKPEEIGELYYTPLLLLEHLEERSAASSLVTELVS